MKGLFGFLIAATLIIGIPLLFFAEKSTTERDYLIGILAGEQIKIAVNVSALQAQVAIMITQTDTINATVIIEQSQIQPISDRIDAINCLGVKTINGVYPYPNRTFLLIGLGGITVTPDSQLIINASALQNQYDNEQMTINTLFLMIMSTDVAIAALDEQVVKSINFQLPSVNTSNIDVTTDGTCGVSVYLISNSTFAVDTCALQANLTNAFAGIQFDFNVIDAQLQDLLNQIPTLENLTLTTAAQVEQLRQDSIFNINHKPTVNNNYNLVGINQITTYDGPSSNEVIAGNRGLVTINGLNSTDNNFNVLPGYGTTIVNNNAIITISNTFYKPPCIVTVSGAFMLYNLAPQATFYPFPQFWAPAVFTPPGCVAAPVFDSLIAFDPFFGSASFGLFYMPEGMWTLGLTAFYGLSAGGVEDFTLALSNGVYTLPFTTITYSSGAGLGTLFYNMQFELTLSDQIIPVGTQMSVQYTSSGNPVTAVSLNNWYMIRVV